MQLSTGASPWQPIPTVPSLGPLTANERCDVAILGTGLSGALTALHLADAGLDVVLLDKRPLSTGSTSVSTALIQYELDSPLVDLIPRYGLPDAQAIYRATRGALDDLRALIETHDIDCDLQQRPTLYLAREPADLIHLKHEAIARAEIGIEARYLDANTLRDRYCIDRPGAIRSSVSYELDPRKLAAGVLSAAVTRGVRIYDRTSARLAPENSNDRVRLTTSDGFNIDCHHVVFATGYETVDSFPFLRDACDIRSTYALLTKPVPADQLWPERALLWELAEPYFYARTTSDNRVLIGGEDDDALDPDTRERQLPMKANRLIEKLEATVGLRDLSIDHAFAAPFAHTDDGLPIIGSIHTGSTRTSIDDTVDVSPKTSSSIHLNLGFGGNGIVFGLIGAQILRDRITGHYNPAAKLFGLERTRIERLTARRPARR